MPRSSSLSADRLRAVAEHALHLWRAADLLRAGVQMALRARHRARDLPDLYWRLDFDLDDQLVLHSANGFRADHDSVLR